MKLNYFILLDGKYPRLNLSAAGSTRHFAKGSKVSIVCLDFNEIEIAVFEGRIDFTITNPAVYVNLEYIYGATRIATLKDQGEELASSQFGGVLFTRSDSTDIRSLYDVRGKALAGVDRTSFGGWLILWRLLQQSGINPYNDPAAVRFLGSHRKVVVDVLNGTTDVGIVRTGILEQMTLEGLIDRSSYLVINQQEAPYFPYVLSTELYPQWALAKMYHVGNELAEQMMLTFFDINLNSEAARTARIQGWTIPLDYYPVHLCLRELKTGPYRYLNAPPPPLTVGQLYREYRSWVWGGTALFLVIFEVMMYMFIFNRKLSATTFKLCREHQKREQTVAELNEFKTTLDNVRDSVFMFDPETLQFLYVNQGGLDQVGYTIEEMRQLTPLAIKPDLSETQFREMLAPLRDFTIDSFTFITRHQRKDGTFLPVEVFLQHIDLPHFFCLHNEMGQVILNILVNAAHAINDKTGSGGEEQKGRITIHTRSVDQQVEITIADTGGGIPAAIASRIFDPFFTTKEVGRGTGQSLAICHDIVVSKHGDTIDFMSTEGEGTSFIVRLPVDENHR